MVTQDRLKSALRYEPVSGQFVWLHRPDIAKWIDARVVGSVAGSIHRKTGYWVIRIDSVNYLAHRLAWLYVHGEWPSEIDHIDRDKTNNALSNLRSVSGSVNCVNRHVRSNSGFKGVTWHCSGKWQAKICRDGQSHYLGVFENKIDAAKAYRDAALIVHGEWTAAMPEFAGLGATVLP